MQTFFIIAGVLAVVGLIVFVVIAMIYCFIDQYDSKICKMADKMYNERSAATASESYRTAVCNMTTVMRNVEDKDKALDYLSNKYINNSFDLQREFEIFKESNP